MALAQHVCPKSYNGWPVPLRDHSRLQVSELELEGSRGSLASFLFLNKYLLSTYYVLDVDLGIGNIVQSDRKKLPALWSLCLLRETGK